jgi:hypothetical protein
MRSKTLLSLILSFVVVTGFLNESQAKKKKGGPDPYYKIPTIFQPHPSSIGKSWNVRNFGPVGIGIDLVRPGMTMKIKNVEKGSPAEKTGKLKNGQIIESINGIVLKDRDPREILGDIITKAEATDGKINLKIKDVGNVLVQIPVMGSYSPTWPLKCEKSDKIVRKLADLLAKQEKPSWGSVLFMLSTGEYKDLEVVKRWMKDKETIGPYPWNKGYMGLGLCEYYLRTGDKSVLPLIKKMTEELKKIQYNGAWSGRGYANFKYMGGGHMNAAGVHCVTFLLMAKYCGVDVDDEMLQSSLKQFYRFAGRGNVAYGDQEPEGGFRDNGKSGGLAVAMAAAAKLTPNGEKSVYAKARENSAMKSFYATNWFHAAHTGGGIGEIWHNVAMSMLHEKRPVQHRSFIDTRRWVMELSRRHHGGIGIAGMTDGYDAAAGDTGDRTWGNFFALTYTIPRKKLQIFGAPKSPHAVNYKLPARPWGNAADDVFQSPLPPKNSQAITMQELLKEKVETDASLPLMKRLGDEKVTDAELVKYLNHPEFGIRSATMRCVVRLGRDHLVLPQLQSSDPRLRHNGILALIGMFKGSPLPQDKITPEMIQEAEKMVNDPNESLWVKKDAVHALRRGGPEVIARNKAQLLRLLKSDEWWMQVACLNTLGVIAMDKAHYKDIIPPMADLMGNTTTCSVMGYSRNMAKSVSKASPEVKAFAVNEFKKAFKNIPKKFELDTGYVIPGGTLVARGNIASLLSKLPGGETVGRIEPKTTMKSKTTGKESDMYVYSGKFIPNNKFKGKWLLVTSASKPEDVKKRLDAIAKKLERENKAAAKSKKKKKKKAKKTYLDLRDKGQVGKSKSVFWTDNMLIDNNLGEARKMMLQNVDGKTYLLVEKGNFDKPDTPEGWHCGYNVYKK